MHFDICNGFKILGFSTQSHLPEKTKPASKPCDYYYSCDRDRIMWLCFVNNHVATDRPSHFFFMKIGSERKIWEELTLRWQRKLLCVLKVSHFSVLDWVSSLSCGVATEKVLCIWCCGVPPDVRCGGMEGLMCLTKWSSATGSSILQDGLERRCLLCWYEWLPSRFCPRLGGVVACHLCCGASLCEFARKKGLFEFVVPRCEMRS